MIAARHKVSGTVSTGFRRNQMKWAKHIPSGADERDADVAAGGYPFGNVRLIRLPGQDLCFCPAVSDRRHLHKRTAVTVELQANAIRRTGSGEYAVRDLVSHTARIKRQIVFAKIFKSNALRPPSQNFLMSLQAYAEVSYQIQRLNIGRAPEQRPAGNGYFCPSERVPQGSPIF